MVSQILCEIYEKKYLSSKFENYITHMLLYQWHSILFYFSSTWNSLSVPTLTSTPKYLHNNTNKWWQQNNKKI